MNADHDLYVLPAPTLREGLEALRAQHDDASGLAPVVPLRPIAGDDIEGKHQGHHRHEDRSLAACMCDDFGHILDGRPCPKCAAPLYFTFGARHVGEDVGA